MVMSAVLYRIKCKVFAPCCGWPSSPPPPNVSSKFKSYDDAIAQLQDDESIGFVGIVGNLQVSGFWFSMVRRFNKTAHPRNLTVVTHGGNGGRGKLPGTLDDVLALKGFDRFSKNVSILAAMRPSAMPTFL